MDTRKVKILGRYRHFKGKLYQVLLIAREEATGRRVVVYQALYGDYGFFVRPEEEFLSEVDHVKYPGVAARYRFEEVEDRETTEELPKEQPAAEKAQVFVNRRRKIQRWILWWKLFLTQRACRRSWTL